MRYRAKDFSEEERNSIKELGKIVAHVFKIHVSELRSNIRKRRFTDARKVLASIASSNIPVGICDRFRDTGFHQLALTAWYLDFDHSTVSYAVDKANALYKVDPEFKMLYDSVISLLNNPTDDLLNRIEIAEFEVDRFTWGDVKDSIAFTHKLRYMLAPTEVVDGICNLYTKGYSVALIADKYRVVPSFIPYLVKMKGIKKYSRSKSFDSVTSLIAKRNDAMFPEVKQSHTIEY